MDLSGFAAVGNVLVPLLIVAALGAVYARRGWMEQTGLGAELQRLSGNAYFVIEHPGLSSAEGIVTVDYCIVSVYGIFLVVIDHRRGRISGREADPTWTLAVRGEDTAVENPLARTASFATALGQVLPGYCYPDPVAIAAYPTGAVLDVKSTQHVTYIPKVLDLIKSYSTLHLTFSQASGIAAALQFSDVNNKADDEVLSDMM